MIQAIAAELGPWNWMVIGFVLLALEIVVPGFFLLWIGCAAIATGLLSLVFWGGGWWVWEVQVLVFLALSLLAVYLGRNWMRGSAESDQPLLNRRAEQLIGRTATLEEALVNGFGRVRIGDTTWRVSGPDLPAGTRVRVTSAGLSELGVEPV